MTTTTSGASPVTQMAELDQAISAKLDFVFSYEDEDLLLTLRSVLGLVRRLLYVREHFAGQSEIRIPLKREPKKIGASLKEIIEDADYEYTVGERPGYSIVVFKGINLANIDSLVSACLLHVELQLDSMPVKFS